MRIIATGKDTPSAAADLYDQLDSTILRASAVSQAHCVALEAAPNALADGTHHHIMMVVETLLSEAQEAARGLFEATRTVAPASAPSSAG